MTPSEARTIRREVHRQFQALTAASDLNAVVRLHPKTLEELSAEPSCSGLDVVREWDRLPLQGRLMDQMPTGKRGVSEEDDEDATPIFGPHDTTCDPKARGAVVRLYGLDVVTDEALPLKTVKVERMGEN